MELLFGVLLVAPKFSGHRAPKIYPSDIFLKFFKNFFVFVSIQELEIVPCVTDFFIQFFSNFDFSKPILFVYILIFLFDVSKPILFDFSKPILFFKTDFFVGRIYFKNLF